MKFKNGEIVYLRCRVRFDARDPAQAKAVPAWAEGRVLVEAIDCKAARGDTGLYIVDGACVVTEAEIRRRLSP